jgi:hypothetical protein
MVIRVSPADAATQNPLGTGGSPPGPSPSPRSAPLRAKRNPRPDRKRAKIVVGVIVVVVSVGVMLVVATRLPIALRPKNLSQAANDTSASNHFDAKVFIDTTGNGDCRQEVFDNQTWRMTRSKQPCDATALDAAGVPIPKGTMNRLEAISKSFREK